MLYWHKGSRTNETILLEGVTETKKPTVLAQEAVAAEVKHEQEHFSTGTHS